MLPFSALVKKGLPSCPRCFARWSTNRCLPAHPAGQIFRAARCPHESLLQRCRRYPQELLRLGKDPQLHHLPAGHCPHHSPQRNFPCHHPYKLPFRHSHQPEHLRFRILANIVNIVADDNPVRTALLEATYSYLSNEVPQTRPLEVSHTRPRRRYSAWSRQH